MQARTDFYTASPDAMKAMLALEAAVGKLSIELPLLELVRLRVSQINGCGFCPARAPPCCCPEPCLSAGLLSPHARGLAAGQVGGRGGGDGSKKDYEREKN